MLHNNKDSVVQKTNGDAEVEAVKALLKKFSDNELNNKEELMVELETLSYQLTTIQGQAILGTAYFKGDVIPENLPKAVELLKKAVDQGSSKAIQQRYKAAKSLLDGVLCYNPSDIERLHCAYVNIRPNTHNGISESNGSLSEPTRTSKILETIVQNPESTSSIKSEEKDLRENIENTLQGYSLHTQKYIKNFNLKETIAKRIKGLRLTPDEAKKFHKFTDFCTHQYMAIPVRLNGHFYDFSTLKDKQNDPITNDHFNKFEIGSAEDLLEEFEELVEKLQTKRVVSDENNKGVFNNILRHFRA
jgi:hypothetical protein